LKIWAFVAVTLPLVLTPGVSTTVVLRTGVTRGAAAALVTAAGLNASSLTYGLMAALGLPALAARWPVMLVVLRYAGGAYVLWLGARATLRGLSRFRNASAASDGRAVPAGALGEERPSAAGYAPLFVEGFVANTLNPPLAAFYFLILPQFVPPGAAAVRSTLILTLIHVSMAATWHVAWGIAGAALAARLSAGRPRASLEIATGVALSALALAILF
jgi:threonine/homoserine/homoserine lactone efflux protein